MYDGSNQTLLLIVKFQISLCLVSVYVLNKKGISAQIQLSRSEGLGWASMMSAYKTFYDEDVSKTYNVS